MSVFDPQPKILGYPAQPVPPACIAKIVVVDGAGRPS